MDSPRDVMIDAISAWERKGNMMAPAVLTDEALAALAAVGYVIVPREPTESGKLAVARAIGETIRWPNHTERATRVYDAVIEAAEREAGDE